MVSCGYEATAVQDGFTSLRGFVAMAKASLFSKYEDRGALELLNAAATQRSQLVQIETATQETLEGTRV